MEKIYYVEKSTKAEDNLYYKVQVFEIIKGNEVKLEELIDNKDYFVFRFYTEHFSKEYEKVQLREDLLKKTELLYKVKVEKLTKSYFKFNSNEFIHEITVRYDLINKWSFEFIYYTDELNMNIDREIYKSLDERRYTFLNINFNEEEIPAIFQKIFNHIFVTKQESNTFKFIENKEINPLG